MSRVLIAGGTGALGQALVPALQAAGHEVTTMSRRPGGSDGVAHVSADALDREAVRRAVTEAAPEVVVHALTALPPGGPRKAADLELTNRLRITGTDNLVAACTEQGVRRLIGESFTFVYGTGAGTTGPISEDQPLEPTGGEATVDALRHLEQAILGAGLEAVILRFGLFYGPGSRVSEEQIAALAKRKLPLPGGAPSLVSFVHMQDAASAVVTAIASGEPGGIYNVADDEPVVLGDFLTELARVTGAPPPRRIPLWPVKLLAPYAAAFVAGIRLPLSNARLRALGWAPAYPTYREGVATLASL